MAVINPTIELAKIRSKIDDAQQKISFLEGLLQETILGGAADVTVQDVIDEVRNIDDESPDGDVIAAAFEQGLVENGYDPDDQVDQQALRHALGVQRSLLGELRVEEGGWNQEVNQEKERRKDLNEFAKG